jgi:F0F1-type ATP synthase delta subunit
MNDLLSNIRTAQEKNEAINLIEEILENIFKREPKDYSNHSPFTKNMSEKIFAEIDNKKIRQDRKQMEAYLMPMLKEIKSMKEVKLTVAATPSEEIINNVKSWLSKNVSQSTVISFEVKPEIIGGVIMVSPSGKYINYALSEQIDKFFTDKKQAILSLLYS